MSFRASSSFTGPYRPIVIAFSLGWAAFSAGCGSDAGSSGAGAGAGGDNAAGRIGQAGADEAGEGGANSVPSDSAGAAGASPDAAGAAGAAGENGGTDTSVKPPPYLMSLAQSSFFVGLDFGSPYDSILGQPITSLKSALQPNFDTAPVAGQLVGNTNIRLIETTEDLYSALNLSASLHVSYGAFGGSAKVDYAKSKHLSSDTIYLFVDATTGGLTNKVVDPALTAAAKKLSPEDFYRSYGDRYVSEIVTGVELFGTIEIQTTSEEDKEALSASLKVSYLASSLSASFSSTFNTTVGSHKVTVQTVPIGFTPAATLDLTDPTKFLSAAANFSSVIGGAANTNAEALTLLYANYYDLPGYPGVPPGTAAKVAKVAGAVSDFTLYDSLVRSDFSAYFADKNYANQPFFSGMLSYRDALSRFLTASFADSQNLPALPTIDDQARIETFATTSHAIDSGPHFVVNSIANGVVPKRLSDYEIPLHYAHDQMLNGVKFSPLSSIQPSIDVTQKRPLVYPLYLVDKTTPPNAQRRVLSYKWDTGTYFLDNATSAGVPDDVKIAKQLDSLQVNDLAHPELGFYKFLLVNKASGQVLTGDGVQGDPLFQSHYVAGQANQLWQFRLFGCSGGTSYTPGIAIYGNSVATPGLWFDIEGANNKPGTKISLWNYNDACSEPETFYIYPGFDSDVQSIGGYGNALTAFMAVTANIAAPTSGAKVAVEAKSGNDNQLWRFIPVELIDNDP
jgi:hypothetical protein